MKNDEVKEMNIPKKILIKKLKRVVTVRNHQSEL